MNIAIDSPAKRPGDALQALRIRQPRPCMLPGCGNIIPDALKITRYCSPSHRTQAYDLRKAGEL